MSHHEFDRLAAYAERQLDAAAAAAISDHLASCSECREALAEIRRGIALASELEPEVMPARLAGVVRARLMPATRWRWRLVAAAALLAAVGTAAYWQARRPWAEMRAASAAPTIFEAEGRRLHETLARGERLEYVPRDDRDAWQWLASQHAPVAGLLPAHSESDRPRFQVTGAAVRTVAGARASVLAYRVDGRPVTLVLAHTGDVADAPAAGWWSKRVTHRRDDRGANVLTWTVGGGTYVMVSELEDYGQRGCFVCHTTPRFQDAIRRLSP